MLDLRHHENKGQYLEGTGSIVLDRIQKIAYVSLSERTHLKLAQFWAKEMGSVLELDTA